MIHVAESVLDLLGVAWSLPLVATLPLSPPLHGDPVALRPVSPAAVSAPLSARNVQEPLNAGARAIKANRARRPPVYFDAPPRLTGQAIWR